MLAEWRGKFHIGRSEGVRVTTLCNTCILWYTVCILHFLKIVMLDHLGQKCKDHFFFSQSSPGANWRESLKATLKARRLRGLSSRTTAALLVILPLPWGCTTLQFQAHTFKTTLRAQPHRQWLQNGMARWCPLPHSRQTHPLLQLYVSNFRVGT